MNNEEITASKYVTVYKQRGDRKASGKHNVYRYDTHVWNMLCFFINHIYILSCFQSYTATQIIWSDFCFSLFFFQKIEFWHISIVDSGLKMTTSRIVRPSLRQETFFSLVHMVFWKSFSYPAPRIPSYQNKRSQRKSNA